MWLGLTRGLLGLFWFERVSGMLGCLRGLNSQGFAAFARQLDRPRKGMLSASKFTSVQFGTERNQRMRSFKENACYAAILFSVHGSDLFTKTLYVYVFFLPTHLSLTIWLKQLLKKGTNTVMAERKHDMWSRISIQPIPFMIRLRSLALRKQEQVSSVAIQQLKDRRLPNCQAPLLLGASDSTHFTCSMNLSLSLRQSWQYIADSCSIALGLFEFTFVEHRPAHCTALP